MQQPASGLRAVLPHAAACLGSPEQCCHAPLPIDQAAEARVHTGPSPHDSAHCLRDAMMQRAVAITYRNQKILIRR